MNEEYREAARSWWSLLVFVAVLAAGFLVDVAFGHAVAHLAGWLLALALVVGLNALVVYAVRSEKSLTVTADELRIGDEAIARRELVGFSEVVDGEDLPVLGWPTGKPRQLRGVTVRLAGGRDVVVPTRFPARLRSALRLDSHPLTAKEQDVRAAARSELGALPEIDERAETLFRLAGYQLPPLTLDEAALAGAAAVFVAGRPPVAFAWVDVVDGLAHVEALAVIPKWMRQGLGTRLLDRVGEWATAKGYPAVTLTTYADVPWNAPFYRARGFVEIDELTPGLAALRKRERELGLDAVGRRVVMRRELST